MRSKPSFLSVFDANSKLAEELVFPRYEVPGQASAFSVSLTRRPAYHLLSGEAQKQGVVLGFRHNSFRGDFRVSRFDGQTHIGVTPRGLLHLDVLLKSNPRLTKNFVKYLLCHETAHYGPNSYSTLSEEKIDALEERRGGVRRVFRLKEVRCDQTILRKIMDEGGIGSQTHAKAGKLIADGLSDWLAGIILTDSSAHLRRAGVAPSLRQFLVDRESLQASRGNSSDKIRARYKLQLRELANTFVVHRFPFLLQKHRPRVIQKTVKKIISVTG